MRKVMLAAACNTTLATLPAEGSQVLFPTLSKGGLDRLVRIYGYVFAAVYKWKKKAGTRGLSSSI
jgi:hypothetical protein